MLSGCIIIKSPFNTDVTMEYGATKKFTVHALPSDMQFTWTLDGHTIPGVTGNSYTYTALAGVHVLVARGPESPIVDTVSWTITAPYPPVAPVANAGPDQIVGEGVIVTLDGSNSTDHDGDIVSYAWVQTDGPTVTLDDPSAIQPTFSAPTGLGESGAALVFELTVTDATALSDTASVVVNVSGNNIPPAAEAGPDQVVAENSLASLDGSASFDTDGTIVTYFWKQTAGPRVVLSDPTAVQPTFTTPNVGPAGESITFKLTVTDDGGLMGTDTVNINVSWSNIPPVSNAGADQTIEEGILVTLDGSASTDPDDEIASYSWVQTAGPSVTLSDPTAINPTFTAPDVNIGGAVLTFELTVTDTGGLINTDSVDINVTWVNAVPAANAGPDQSAARLSVVYLNGTGSTDPDSDGIASYHWVQTGGTAVTLINANSAIAYFFAPFDTGPLTFELTVTDPGALSSSDSCTITVTPTGDLMKLSGGFNFTLAVKADGTLWAWGANAYGQLGDGTTVNKLLPTQIGSSNDWLTVSAGNYHSLAIKTDGTLWAWGFNGDGQLGLGDTVTRVAPTQVGTDTNWAAIDAGSNHSVGIKADGTLMTWGDNAYGQLGSGSMMDSNVPSFVGDGLPGWLMIDAGGNHTAAIDGSGKLWTWGRNGYGQLGIGNLITKYEPMQVGTETTWVLVSAGDDQTIAKKASGTLWGFGKNLLGQLGDGTTVSKVSPVQITSATNWYQFDTGTAHTLALKNDSTLYAWGYNSNGQLGDGTTVNKTVPTAIDGSGWLSVDIGYFDSFALKSDSSLWSWGYNVMGQLGDGTVVDKNIPTQIIVLGW